MEKQIEELKEEVEALKKEIADIKANYLNVKDFENEFRKVSRKTTEEDLQELRKLHCQ